MEGPGKWSAPGPALALGGLLMVFLTTRKLYTRLGYLSPDARNLTVVAPSSCWYPASLSLAHSLHQLIKHGRLHPEVVEGLWVFYSELLHQSGVMSIQRPPLLCELWTGPISSGSSPPLCFSGLLHISFEQVLLEDSNLEQSNIVQEVHTL